MNFSKIFRTRGNGEGVEIGKRKLSQIFFTKVRVLTSINFFEIFLKMWDHFQNLKKCKKMQVVQREILYLKPDYTIKISSEEHKCRIKGMSVFRL